MKRKKSPSEKAAPVQQNAVVSPAQFTASAVIPAENRVQDTAKVVLFSVLLFLAMTVQTGQMSLILAALALISALPIGKAPLLNLRQRLCVPVIGLLAFALMNGVAAIYSPFGADAVSEFYKIFAALSLAFILLARFEKQHIRGLLWGVTAVCGVIALLSVDSAVHGGLFAVFNASVEALGATFSNIEQDLFGTRVSGIYNDANVTASIFALGALSGLHLTFTGKAWKEKAAACFLLGVCAQGFFLSMSRGAFLGFAAALLVYLAAAGKGNRLELFFLMFISAMVTVALSIPAMSSITAGNLLPDILTLVTGVGIFALYYLVGEKAAAFLDRHLKAAVAVFAALAVVVAGYAVAAMSVTGAYTFDETGYLQRSFQLEPGTYTLSGAWDGEVQVTITAQTELDVMRREGSYTTLYNGAAADAAFTITGEEFRTSIMLRGQVGEEIREITFSDGTEVALAHPLLPRFVANRLQDDLFTSNSFLQRVQFFKDGWALFVKSPLIGHGLGSSEGLLTSVQPYYYESKFIHNQPLQVMSDMGILGLSAFLVWMLGTAWLLLRRLRKGPDPLAAMLLACWVMMNAHSLMELTFSVRAYQCAAFTLLLLPVLLYGEPISQKAAKLGGLGVGCVIWLYLVVFGGLLLSHRMTEKAAAEFSTRDAVEFLNAMRSYTSRDVFDHEQYQLTYVGNTATLNDSRFNKELWEYVEELRDSGTYTACSGLARYYYLPRGEYKEMFACSREGIAQEASAKDAWNLQLAFYRTDVLNAITAEEMDVYLDGVQGTVEYLAEYSEGRLEEIELTEENQTFLDTVAMAANSDLSDEDAYRLLAILANAPVETPEG